MTKFIEDPFTKGASFNLSKYWETIGIAVRFLDNVLDVTKYPYEKNKEIALRDRRIGLNPFAGLGDTLAMMMLPYDSNKARVWVSSIARDAMDSAYEVSALIG